MRNLECLTTLANACGIKLWAGSVDYVHCVHTVRNVYSENPEGEIHKTSRPGDGVKKSWLHPPGFARLVTSRQYVNYDLCKSSPLYGGGHQNRWQPGSADRQRDLGWQ